MDQSQQAIFELLKNLRQITLVMKEEVEAGKWEQFPLHVQERQEVIEKLSNSLATLGAGEKEKVLSILVEVLHLDEDIRTRVEDLMRQDLLKLKGEQDKLSALRHFRDSMAPPLYPRFLEKKG